MSALAPTLQAFFTDRLLTQRLASPRTVAAYRDTFRLMLQYAHERLNKAPSQLDLADLNAPFIGSFLTHLERDRHNGVPTRNARLAAIHSLFRYAALRHPEHADVIQRVLAIPAKRGEHGEVTFLKDKEVEAILGSVNRTTWTGRRDYALLVVAIQTGLRLGEIAGLVVEDLELGVGAGAYVRCHGKGRKQRATPLTTSTVAVLRVWLQELRGRGADPVFPTLRGGPMSSDAVQWLLAKYTSLAAKQCPSLSTKKVTPHVLRHTCAMNLLQSGVDITVIALWLGHESVQTTMGYLHADMALKERALARTTPPDTKPGRYRPSDQLLAFLEAL